MQQRSDDAIEVADTIEVGLQEPSTTARAIRQCKSHWVAGLCVGAKRG
jgi:hypothetical protein